MNRANKVVSIKSKGLITIKAKIDKKSENIMVFLLPKKYVIGTLKNRPKIAPIGKVEVNRT